MWASWAYYLLKELFDCTLLGRWCVLDVLVGYICMTA